MNNKTIAISVMSLVVGAIIAFAISGYAKTDNLKSTKTLSGEVVLGNKESEIEVVEYTSLACKTCANFHNNGFKKIEEELINSGKVKYILRHLPTTQNAFYAAMISSCVEQDKAGDFIAELYNKQGKWANSDSHSGLKEIALSNGVSSNEFYSCIENESLAENIKKARNEGAKKYKIKSTPTFVINGEKLESVSSAEDLITAVQDKQEGKSANDTLKKRAQEVLSLGDNDKILGDESAPITIVEYASLSCPHCANFHEKILPQLKSDMINTGKAKLVFRHFPLNAPALDAAIIAECADKKDFYKYIGEFYKQQKSWAFEKDYKSKLMEISGKLGMSSEVFDKCLQNKELKDKIIEEVSKASQKLGVSSTPTFFINGEKAGGVHSAEEFKAEITKATK